ncbi:hypothetical protein FLAG1_09496 [Fusarium langsethiae]|uniref:Uncharacterized protein n=1 Tax=Fusarium langsethiae TaxID=179993 RepID=A0A0M9EQB6_FUSLA|nr:hypothetical protein FLAG1_09496 [Fusarium langsethiae]
MTTKEMIDDLWKEGSSNLSDEYKRPYHEFQAGTFRNFECAADCKIVSFKRGDEVLARKTPPGRMQSVPADITILVHGGETGGRAKAS